MADPMTVPLTLGCAQLGNLYEARSDDDAHAILDAAWQSGIRRFDTAPHYGLGLSERRLGDFLRTKPRSEFTISTKVGRLLLPRDESGDELDDEGFVVPAAYRRVWDFSASGVLASLEQSLIRLGLDHVDTVLIHDPDDHIEQALTEGVPALATLRAQGIVSSIGVGNRDTALLARFVRETDIDVVMLAGRYTLLDQSALDDLLPACEERGIGVLNAAIFNSGILAAESPVATAHFEYGAPSRGILDRVTNIARVCEAQWTSLPAAAIAFASTHPTIRSIVVGADDAGQVRTNIALQSSPPTADFWSDLVAHGLLRRDAAALVKAA